MSLMHGANMKILIIVTANIRRTNNNTRRDSGAQYLVLSSKFNTNNVARLESTSVCFIFTLTGFGYFYFLMFMVEIRMLTRKYQ